MNRRVDIKGRPLSSAHGAATGLDSAVTLANMKEAIATRGAAIGVDA
jgi:hypothetical protein